MTHTQSPSDLVRELLQAADGMREMALGCADPIEEADTMERAAAWIERAERVSAQLHDALSDILEEPESFLLAEHRTAGLRACEASLSLLSSAQKGGA